MNMIILWGDIYVHKLKAKFYLNYFFPKALSALATLNKYYYVEIIIFNDAKLVVLFQPCNPSFARKCMNEAESCFNSPK